LVSWIAVYALSAESTEFNIPYSTITAPVVHIGRYHVLSCENTHIVLDGARGMALRMIGYGPLDEEGLDTRNAVMTNGCLKAVISSGEKTVVLNQFFDPSARLQIIDQGPGRVGARVYFSLCSEDGFPHGSGTLDIYVYEKQIFLVPSLYIDCEEGKTTITQAGFFMDIPGKNTELIASGAKLISRETARSVPFDEASEGFAVTVNNPGRFSMKIGWLRNQYPPWLYLKHFEGNPEVDELYEKWPPWITQRGEPLTWNVTPNSGLSAGFTGSSLDQLNFLWVNGDSLDISVGGYKALNGIMALFLESNAAKVQNLWESHEKPLKPVVKEGEFRYYNEIEGVYEIDSVGGDVDVTFDNISNSFPRPVFVRIWNLTGNGACVIKADSKSVPFGLFNDGDIVEDPMVSIVKHATGAARYATSALTVKKTAKNRLTMKCTTGIQLTYQMYSDLETCEAWSDACIDRPLFRFHLKRGAVYHATLPGKESYAFFKLPLYWLKNGVNENTFMNHTRGFALHENGPDRLRFTYTGVNLQGTGLSKYTVTVPYERVGLTFVVNAEFSPLDDGRRWRSVEYCDLYPFDSVYRRNFHYDSQ